MRSTKPPAPPGWLLLKHRTAEADQERELETRKIQGGYKEESNFQRTKDDE